MGAEILAQSSTSDPGPRYPRAHRHALVIKMGLEELSSELRGLDDPVCLNGGGLEGVLRGCTHRVRLDARGGLPPVGVAHTHRARMGRVDMCVPCCVRMWLQKCANCSGRGAWAMS